MITKREIFDRVAHHLLTQMKESRAVDGRCLYRGPGGTKCAIGCLIDDDFYRPALEGFGAASENVFAAISDSLSSPEIPLGFLEDLQAVHDRQDPADWRVCLQEYATANGLEWHQ